MKNKTDEILEQIKTDYRAGNFQNFPLKKKKRSSKNIN